MKNNLMGEEVYGTIESKVATVVPIANTLTAVIDLYKSLARGEILKPIKTEKVGDHEYKIQVFPRSAKEKIMAGAQKVYLYVKGEPQQISPMGNPAGIIAVLGAGNYSSALEIDHHNQDRMGDRCFALRLLRCDIKTLKRQATI